MNKLEYYTLEKLLVNNHPHIIIIIARGDGKKHFEKNIEKIRRAEVDSRGECSE